MKTRQRITAFLMNLVYFMLVFGIALAISTLALARRLNSYQATNTPFVLQLRKEEVELVNTVSGQVNKIMIEPGQHVKKGDLLVQLTDDATEAKISTLEKLADENVSARTEAEVLKTLAPQYEIRAPRDGIIYKVYAVEDTYIQNNTPLLVMFSDENVKLVTEVSPDQYTELLKQKKLDVFSSRREQVFSVKLEAVSRVIPATEHQPSKYELYFQFVNPEDAASFIQGENVDVVAKTRDEEALKPTNLITTFWNSLVMGK
jgi:multidrug resistance efflux pump